MPVALNISTHDVKLVSFRGEALEKWVSAPLPPDAVKDGQILQPGEVAEVINSLFKMLQMPRTKIIASISGMSFTYRLLKLPRLKPALLREAIQRATQKEINVPLNELYIDWQTVAASSSQMVVFVLGVPRSQIDSLIKTTRLINLGLSSVDLKSLSLARASGLSNGLIVDFEPDGFNIIILSQGIPVTLHTFNPRSTKASLEDNIQQLVDELERTIDFYNITHKDHPIFRDEPIMLTGEMSASPATRELLQQNTAHPVKPLTTRFKIPADFPLASFAGNIGLILKKTPSKILSLRADKPDGNINVDPLLGRKRVHAGSVSYRKLLLPVAVFMALVIVVVLSNFRQKAAAETSSLQRDMDGITRSSFLHNMSLSQAEETQAAINQLKKETTKMQQEIQTLSGREQISALLDLVLASLPAGAEYRSIVFNAGTITVDGVAVQRSDVFDYARRLEEAGLLSEVRICSIDDTPAGPENPERPFQAAYKIIIER